MKKLSRPVWWLAIVAASVMLAPAKGIAGPHGLLMPEPNPPMIGDPDDGGEGRAEFGVSRLFRGDWILFIVVRRVTSPTAVVATRRLSEPSLARRTR